MTIIKMAIAELFNSWVDVLDLAINSNQYIILPKKEIVCRNCGTRQSIVQNKKYISFLCACGCRIYYPPNKEGIIISKFISKEDYKGGANGRK